MLLKGFTYFMLILNLTLAEEDRNDWIDPNDMLNFDPATNLMIRKKYKYMSDNDGNDKESTEHPDCACEEKCPPCPDPVMYPPSNKEPQQNCVCEQAALPLLQQYIGTLLDHLGDHAQFSETEDYLMDIKLLPGQIQILEKFRKVGNQNHVHDVHIILGSMIQRIKNNQLGRLEKCMDWLEHKLGLSFNRFLQLLALIALASFMLIVEIKLQIAWRRRIRQLIILMFVISVPWTWLDLYKQAEIKQQSTASKTAPEDCYYENQNIWSTMFSYFTFKNDKCHEYYDMLLIDPVIKVPPTKAIAVTFVRFFLSPMKDVGTALSEFIRALFIDLPVPVYPIAFFMVVLLLFMFFGYSIRLPFCLGAIEPGHRMSVADNVHKAIQDNTKETTEQLEKLQSRLTLTESNLATKLKQLEKVQKSSYEYNTSLPSSLSQLPNTSLSEMNSGTHSSITVIRQAGKVIKIKEFVNDENQSKSAEAAVGFNNIDTMDTTFKELVKDDNRSQSAIGSKNIDTMDNALKELVNGYNPYKTPEKSLDTKVNVCVQATVKECVDVDDKPTKSPRKYFLGTMSNDNAVEATKQESLDANDSAATSFQKHSLGTMIIDVEAKVQEFYDDHNAAISFQKISLDKFNDLSEAEERQICVETIGAGTVNDGDGQ